MVRRPGPSLGPVRLSQGFTVTESGSHSNWDTREGDLGLLLLLEDTQFCDPLALIASLKAAPPTVSRGLGVDRSLGM